MSLRRPLRLSLILAVLAALVAFVAGCVAGEKEEKAGKTDANHVQVSNAWITATGGVESVTVTGGGATLENTSDRDLTVKSAKIAPPHQVENVVFIGADGEPVSELVIPAGATVELTQHGAGPRLEFQGLEQPIDVGIQIPVVLTFSDDSELTFDAQAIVPIEGGGAE